MFYTYLLYWVGEFLERSSSTRLRPARETKNTVTLERQIYRVTLLLSLRFILPFFSHSTPLPTHCQLAFSHDRDTSTACYYCSWSARVALSAPFFWRAWLDRVPDHTESIDHDRFESQTYSITWLTLFISFRFKPNVLLVEWLWKKYHFVRAYSQHAQIFFYTIHILRNHPVTAVNIVV